MFGVITLIRFIVSDKLTIEDDMVTSGKAPIILFDPETTIVCINFLPIRDDGGR
jgi:hypothetical protein